MHQCAIPHVFQAYEKALVEEVDGMMVLIKMANDMIKMMNAKTDAVKVRNRVRPKGTTRDASLRSPVQNSTYTSIQIRPPYLFLACCGESEC